MHGQLLGHVGRHLSGVDEAGSEQTTAQKKPPEEYLSGGSVVHKGLTYFAALRGSCRSTSTVP